MFRGKMKRMASSFLALTMVVTNLMSGMTVNAEELQAVVEETPKSVVEFHSDVGGSMVLESGEVIPGDTEFSKEYDVGSEVKFDLSGDDGYSVDKVRISNEFGEVPVNTDSSGKYYFTVESQNYRVDATYVVSVQTVEETTESVEDTPSSEDSESSDEESDSHLSSKEDKTETKDSSNSQEESTNIDDENETENTSEKHHSILIKDTEGGKVYANSKKDGNDEEPESQLKAIEGDKVRLLVEPDDGYTLKKFTVLDSMGSAVEVLKGEPDKESNTNDEESRDDSVYHFIMPDSDISIEAVFEVVVSTETSSVSETDSELDTATEEELATEEETEKVEDTELDGVLSSDEKKDAEKLTKEMKAAIAMNDSAMTLSLEEVGQSWAMFEVFVNRILVPEFGPNPVTHYSHILQTGANYTEYTHTAYCIQYGVTIPAGSHATESLLPQPQQDYMGYALAYGWKQSGTSYDEGQYQSSRARTEYAVTQAIVWACSQGKFNTDAGEAAIQQILQNTYEPGYAQTYYQQLKDAILKAETVPSFSGKDSGSAPTIELHWNPGNNRYEATVTDSNGVLDRYNYTYGDIHFERNGNNLTIWTNSLYVDGVVAEAVYTNVGGAGSVITWDGENGTQDLATYAEISNEVHSFIRVKTEALGSIEIIKSSSKPDLTSGNSNYSLAGAVFGVYNSSNTEIGRITTDEKGYGRLDDVLIGTYTVKEIKAPKGFKVNASSKTCSVTAGTTSSVAISDEPIFSRISISKRSGCTNITDGNSQYSLKGAKYGVYNTSNTLMDTLVTNEEGKATSKELPAGTYRVKEIEAPPGYALDENTHEITVGLGNTGALSLVEAPWSDPVSVLLRKKDSNTGSENPSGGALLNGAKYQFDYYDVVSETPWEGGRQPMRSWVFETGKDPRFPGFIFLNETHKVSGDSLFFSNSGIPTIPKGTVVVYEIEAPEGYNINEGVNVLLFSGQFGENGNSISDFNTIISPEDVFMGDIQITKFWLDDGSTIKHPEDGAEFEIVCKESGDKYTITTDENGIATTVEVDSDGKLIKGHLPYGNYTVTQTKGKPGYALAEPFDVYINSDMETKYYIVENNEITAPVKLVKKDSTTGKIIPIANTTFKLRNKVTGEYVSFRINYPSQVTISEFKTDESGTFVLPEKLGAGTYEFVEIKAPDGYILNTVPAEFSITESFDWDNPIVIEYENTPAMGKVKVTKKDADTGDVVEKATFNIIADEDIITGDGTVRLNKNEVADTITTDKTGVAISKELFLGKYHLEEVAQPDGFVRNQEAVKFELVYTSQTIPVVELDLGDFDNKPTEINIFKYVKDTENREPLKGISFNILNTDGDVVKSGTTDDNGKLIIKYLAPGEYSIVESATDKGYILDSTPINFSIDKDGLIEGKEVGYFEKENDFTKVAIEKYNADGSKAVLGAKLQLLAIRSGESSFKSKTNTVIHQDFNPIDSWTEEINGENEIVYLIDEWVTDGTSHIIERLPQGDSYQYIIREAEAPNGFVTAKDVFFKVENTSELQTFKMFDKKVSAVKVDADDKPFSGAKLRVVDGNKNTVDEWVTDGTTHDISGLKENNSYTLMEVEAPEGYAIAEPVEFTVDDDKTDLVLSMTDIRVSAYKYSEALNQLVPGAKLEVRDSNDNVVDTWVTDETFHYISNLVVGNTYTLVEVEAPKGFVKANPIEFTVANTNEDQVVTMVDKQVIVSKVDTEVIQIAGAHLEVRDENGNVVDSWISDGKAHKISGLVAGHTYTLVETKAPEGYAIALPIVFTVSDDAINQEFNMIDKQMFVTKVDISGEKEVEGAELKVVDSEGNVVDSWVSGKEPHPISNIVVGETYTLYEDYAPEGYVIANSVEFTVTTENVNQTIKMIDTRFAIEKFDASGHPLKGAKLQILSTKSKNIVDEWVSDGDVHYANGLIAGETYILREIEAPEGYAISPDEEFTVEDNFQDGYFAFSNKQVLFSKWPALDSDSIHNDKVIESDENSQTNIGTEDVVDPEFSYDWEIDNPDPGYTMPEDAELDVDFSFAGEDEDRVELVGAEFTVWDLKGNAVDNWVQGETPHAIRGLTVGETYIVEEIVPAEGYVAASPIQFTVARDYKDQRVIMKDKQVFVTKTDITGETELEGAELVVTSTKTKEIVDKWVSDGTPHAISGLRVGETYILHEEVAPEGYVVASDIEFSVKDDFKVQEIIMKDKQVFVSKTSISGKEEVIGAELEVVDSEGNVVDKWVSEKEPHAVTGLVVGNTYTLVETKPANGYVTAEKIEFKVEDDFEIQEVVMKDDVTKVSISKKDITNKEELPGAKLQIIDKDGKVVEEWISTKEEHYIEKLPIGDYILREIIAPNGYEIAEDVKFTIKDTAEIQHVVMYDSPTPALVKTNEPMGTYVGILLMVLAGLFGLFAYFYNRKKTYR